MIALQKLLSTQLQSHRDVPRTINMKSGKEFATKSKKYSSRKIVGHNVTTCPLKEEFYRESWEKKKEKERQKLQPPEHESCSAIEDPEILLNLL